LLKHILSLPDYTALTHLVSVLVSALTRYTLIALGRDGQSTALAHLIIGAARPSHRFYSKCRPSFRWFQHLVTEKSGTDIAVSGIELDRSSPRVESGLAATNERVTVLWLKQSKPYQLMKWHRKQPGHKNP
jgi:hypothetical protein